MGSGQSAIAPRQTLAVEAYGRTIAIDLDEIFPLPYLPFDWRPADPTVAADRRYRVARTTKGWTTQTDDEPPFTLGNAGAVADHIEGDLHHWLATYTRGYLFVHAGCVSWRERAIVIPGRSHAGKSTLTRALVEAGATYYSDDYAVIDPSGAIWPFARRLSIRPVTQEAPHRLDPRSSQWNVGHAPVRAGLVAEVRFDREAGWAVEAISSGLGTLSLLDNTVAARERPEDSLRMMVNLMEGALAIKGTRDSAEPSALRLLAMIDELLDGPSPTP